MIPFWIKTAALVIWIIGGLVIIGSTLYWDAPERPRTWEVKIHGPQGTERYETGPKTNTYVRHVLTKIRDSPEISSGQ